MRIIALKETKDSETRCSMTPEVTQKLVQAGAQVVVEQGIGQATGFSDTDYKTAGAELSPDRTELLSTADVLLRVNQPSLDEIAKMKANALHISFLDPFFERPTVEALAKQKVSTVSMEMIPRITRAQKMDALSSQANLAGYAAVVLAAQHLPKAFPMMMTAAGTLTPAKVFVIGAGVAGLQAIATARRLGARVEAFDTRPEAAEQIRSLGAKVVQIDLGETGQTKEGYAKALTPEQLEKQRQAMAKVCKQSDIVITTALLFGRKAPLIINQQTLNQMRAGSWVVDMAAEKGGNVQGTKAGEVTDVNGVKIIGAVNLAGRVALHASQVYTNNLFNLIDEYWDADQKKLDLNLEDDILKGCLLTHAGEICNAQIQAFYAKSGKN